MHAALAVWSKVHPFTLAAAARMSILQWRDGCTVGGGVVNRSTQKGSCEPWKLCTRVLVPHTV